MRASIEFLCPTFSATASRAARASPTPRSHADPTSGSDPRDRAALLPLHLIKHPHEYRSERPVLLAVDQQLGEGAALRVGLELANPFGAVEVRET